MAGLAGVLAFATALAPAGASPSPPSPAPLATWVLLSDLHFNPLDDAALGPALTAAPVTDWHRILTGAAAAPSGYGRDTNFALLESALAEMRRRVPDPPVVVVAGDFLAHEFPARFAKDVPAANSAAYPAFVDKTIAFLANELDATFPHAQFVITLGNNDGYCDDYAGTPGSPFLAHMAAAFAPLVERGGRAPEFERDFSRAGYYAVGLPGAPGAQAIVFDSVYWSAKYHNACGVPGSDPGAAEFAWLDQTLQRSPAAPFRWFVSHIPPAVDQFSSLLAGRPVPFLVEADTRRLVAATLAARPAEFVLGHVHHASFELIGPGDGTGVPAPVVPSISAVQGNDPAFVAAAVSSATGTIDDLRTYVLPLETPGAAWKLGYDFDAAFGTASFDASGLLALQSRLAAEPALWSRYSDYYNSGSVTAAPVPGTWPWYWCGDLELVSDAYGACVANLTRSAPATSSGR